MWNQPLIKQSYDVTSNDGLHEFDANVTFFMNSKHKLDKSGMHILEDITNSDVEKWHNFKCNGYSFELIKYKIHIMKKTILL